MGQINMRKARSLLWTARGKKKFFQRRISQYPVDLILWEMFLNSHPDIVSLVEIGSQDGGSSLFFALQAYQRGMEFKTFDIVCSDALEECFETPLAQLVGLRQKFVLGDIFGESRTELVNLLTKSLPHPILMFCDGPHKRPEVQEYVPCLESGDYWAVHDWSDSRDEAGEVFPDEIAWMQDKIEPLHWDIWTEMNSITRFWRIR